MNSAVRHGQARTQVLLPRISYRHVTYHQSASYGGHRQNVLRYTTSQAFASNSTRRGFALMHAIASYGYIRLTNGPVVNLRFRPFIPSLHVRRLSTIVQPKDARATTKDENNEKRWSTRTIDVPVGGNGFVSLDIHAPISKSASDDNTEICSKDILIYLPRGPLPGLLARQSGSKRHTDTLEEYGVSLSGLLRRLLSSTNIPTVVQIWYRLSPTTGLSSDVRDLRFPAPVHDVSVAFDWILNNRETFHGTQMDTTQRYDVETLLNEQEPRISVFGSYIGGSLALMLGLTQPNDIHSIAVYDPVTDWVGLDELEESTSLPGQSIAKKRTRVNLELVRTRTNAAAKALINVRTRLFRSPSGFFDAFASPLMFLRAPGRDTPLWKTAAPEIEAMVTDDEIYAEVLRTSNEVEVSELETRELVHERGYGPYDDDWSSVTSDLGSDLGRDLENAVATESTEQGLTPDLSQVITDLSTLSLGGHSNFLQQMQHQTELTPPRQSPTDLSSSDFSQRMQEPLEIHTVNNPANSTSFIRRRKVLRRWPPVGRPEDVDLPYVKIFSTTPDMPVSSERDEDIQISYVLNPQANEMADVMRRACFWGREKGLGEERVSLERVKTEHVTSEDEAGLSNDFVIERAVEWFSEVNKVEK